MRDRPVHRFQTDPIRRQIEQLVSSRLGRGWRVTRLDDRAEYASHPAAVLTDGTYAVFAKLAESDTAADEFDKEVAGLRRLTELAGVRTPVVLGTITLDRGSLLVMEAVELVERKPRDWREMGRALARIHGVRGERFGLDSHCYWGGLLQDNTPLADWPSFFWERRCVPRLKAAVDSGRCPAGVIPEVERVAAELTKLCGPHVRPTLLHGDAQQNNFLSTTDGPVLIDPSTYYGHPEVDLAYVDFFAPVSKDLFAAYHEVRPIDRGFAQRRDLWLVPVWLAMVQVEGSHHLDGLLRAVRRYR